MDYKEGDILIHEEDNTQVQVVVVGAEKMTLKSLENEFMWIVDRFNPNGFIPAVQEDLFFNEGLSREQIVMKVFETTFAKANPSLSLRARAEECVDASNTILKDLFGIV